MAGGPTGWGSEALQQWAAKRRLLVDIGSRQVVYGEEVTQEGSQGRSSEVVLAMVRRMRRRTVRDCSLASRRPAVATGSFACRTNCRAIPLKISHALWPQQIAVPSPTHRILEAVFVP